MYIPACFRENRAATLHALIRAHPLGTLVTHGSGGLQASPLPFLLDADAGERGVLRAHMAKANPHWQALAECPECLVIFHGPDGYVTPAWYPGKAATHRAVPTWNYATVQVRGKPSIIEDAAWLRQQLDELTTEHEAPRPQPWSIADAPADYIATQMQAIVGIEIPIAHIEGKWKMSQNKDAADRAGVVNGMRAEDDPHRNLRVAEMVERG